ncbi:hypothetical protein NDU88_002801 [Pleurodeles waltl]|uniref:DNA-directed DNA polymerase n=1 Tax=Pleurodeles waltl TaxID=8319 RepID=A0AAV7UWQ4_PLEWA|nr:hypothetical protein NDU88_002801 [Pleurodeles waltl]
MIPRGPPASDGPQAEDSEPVFLKSVRRRLSRDVFDAETFLENLSKLLQNKAQLLAYKTFRIVALVFMGCERGASRTLKSVMYSKIDFNTGATNMCLATSITGLLVDRATTDRVIMSMAAAAHEVLQLPANRLVAFGDLALFENHFAVTVKVLYYSSSWKYFTTNEHVKNKTVYVLHHENHFYGILNLNSFLGAKYVCEHCEHIYNNQTRHQCETHCKMCQRDGWVNNDAQKVNCSTCEMFGRSQDCLNVHTSLAQCVHKSDCRACRCYMAEDHDCKGMQCPRCKAYFISGIAHKCYMLEGFPQKKTEDYIVFDIECTQETAVHKPNYIYAHHLTADENWEFEGRSCVNDFLNTFMQPKYHEYTMLAYNSKAYDSFFFSLGPDL